MILPPHRRGELTKEQWQRLKPLLPDQKPAVGRPSNDHCTTINGMLWILRTGAPWRDLPSCYGAWETVAGRFYRWSIHRIVAEDFTVFTSTSRCQGAAKLEGASR